MTMSNDLESTEQLSGSYEFERQEDEQNRLLPANESTSNNINMTKSQILKNVFIKSIAFLFLFAPFQALCNLQSTLNVEDGIGHGGLTVIYASLVFSCLFLPSFVIAHIGLKWTIVLSMMCYILYMVANLDAIWGLIGPSAAILGIGAGPLWTAQCTYLTQLAIGYSKLTRAKDHDAIHHFFGYFFLIFQTSQVFGNLMSSGVLSKKSTTNKLHQPWDECAANFKSTMMSNNTNFDSPDKGKTDFLFGIYIFLAFIAYVFVAICLEGIHFERQTTIRLGRNSVRLLLSTFQHWKTYPTQRFLVILTIYSGIEQAFMTSVYTKAFISCALGIDYVGYVLICYGVVNSLCSFIFSRLVPCVGTSYLYILAFVLHGGTQIVLIIWKPQQGQEQLFYIFAALWGMGEAVIKTQTNALYGCLFIDNLEAAFANYRLLESIGFIVMFALADVLQIRTKLYICLGTLTCGMIMYGILDVKLRYRGE